MKRTYLLAAAVVIIGALIANGEIQSRAAANDQATTPIPAGPHQWNQAAGCYDESDYPGQFIAVPYDESLNGAYDPNWISAAPLGNGCTYYFHPNQGHGNGPAEKDQSVTPAPKMSPTETPTPAPTETITTAPTKAPTCQG